MLSMAWFIVKKQVKNIVQHMCYNSFQGGWHRQMAQANKWSNHGCLTGTICVQRSLCPFEGTADWSLAMRCFIEMGGAAYTWSFRCPYRKKPKGLQTGNRGGHTIGPCHPVHLPGYVAFKPAGHLPHSPLELHHAESTTSAKQLEAHL
jgi:hypothetical protein